VLRSLFPGERGTARVASMPDKALGVMGEPCVDKDVERARAWWILNLAERHNADVIEIEEYEVSTPSLLEMIADKYGRSLRVIAARYIVDEDGRHFTGYKVIWPPQD
jgi:hypothetical protein